ncbi:MAG: nucleotidyl transferase AbiEii/AbiGii toxin family protein [Bacteroidota bacterium]
MITQKEIIDIAEKKKLKTSTIDKDWVLGHFLNAFYSLESTKTNFIFKGGTALKKCYFNDYRFSEDLDFTLLDKKFIVDDVFIKNIMKTATKNSGIQFHILKQKFQKSDEEGQGYEIKINYWGADHKPNQKPLPVNRWQTQIKLDISFSEKIISEPVKKSIFHEYSDMDTITNIIPVYSINEVISEKTRALIQRNRPRDIYDIAFLSKIIETENYTVIKEMLIKKATDKQIKINGITDFVNENKGSINKRAWQSSLGHHLAIGQLPDFNTTYSVVSLFIEQILKS